MLKKIIHLILISTLMSSIILHHHISLADTSLKGVINHLLRYIEESNCNFIRNDKEYDSKYAAEHIREKYNHFRKEIHNVEDFIELCATKSLLSSKPYFVKCAPNTKILTAEWLRKELIKYYGTSQVSGKGN